ncbi:hypothetical protein [Nitrosomonas communis]
MDKKDALMTLRFVLILLVCYLISIPAIGLMFWLTGKLTDWLDVIVF